MSGRQDLKTRTKNRQRLNKLTSASAASSQKPTQKFTEDALLNKAEEFMERYEVDLALQFCDRALSQSPDHPRALEVKALVLLETQRPAEAYQLLVRATQVAPDQGWSKYLYLGQMCSGEEAAQYLSKGIELLAHHAEQLHHAGPDHAEELADTNAQISSAFCALAEVYLTDLCEVENAQETCLALMEKALQYDPHNAETLQTMASIQISCQDPRKAREYLLQSLATWFKDEESRGDGDDEMEQDLQPAAAAAMDVDDDAELPPYEFRINTAKLLIELDLRSQAASVLLQLISEDDKIMQVWYLLGWCLHLEEDMEAAVEALERAKELYVLNKCEREDVLAHIAELLGDATSTSSAAQPAS